MVARKMGRGGRERARIPTYRVEVDITFTVAYSYHAHDDDIQIGMIYLRHLYQVDPFL